MKTKILSSIFMGCIAMACGGGAAEGPMTTHDPSPDDSDPTTTASDEESNDDAMGIDQVMDDANPDAPSMDIADDNAAPTSDEPMIDEEVADEESEPVVEEEADTTAPSIISIFPENEAKGVRADDVIVIEFSEAMDQEATRAAYISDDLPSDAVTFAWDESGTQLTITPDQALAYEVGWIAEEVPARRYTYSLNGATDLAGNALPDQALQFDLARMVLAVAPVWPSGTGVINVNTGETDNNFGAGDSESGDIYRGFVTFLLPELPVDRLDSLILFQTHQAMTEGAPFTNLVTQEHALCLSAAEFANMVDVQLMSMPAPIGDLSTSPQLGQRSVDVTSEVEARYDAEEPWAQFLIEFAVPTDGVGSQDAVGFDLDQTRLSIGYLLQ